MNRWQAYTQIVRAFLYKGRPGYALVALALIVAPPIVGVLVLYSVGQPALSEMAKLKAPR